MSNVTTSGVLKDTTGTNTLLITQGTSITSLWMTSTGVNKDLSVGLTPMINYPSVTGITDSFSANSLTVTVVMSSPAGNICQVNVQVRTCILQGKGEIPMVAKGWVWAEYDDKVKDHYKWRMKIEDIVPKEERTKKIEFHGSIQVTTHANYSGSCHKPKV
ncbi:hypothetical protein FB446DRAFT_730922 [Lentinula raphanica]|nr:hypothetical protein FB446DRAFT_730922 [Lentinula raphanica]